MLKNGVILGFGIGIVLGSGLTCIWIYKQLNLQVQQLLSQISIIREQLEQLRKIIENDTSPLVEKSNVLANGSSLDDDEIFEEACDCSDNGKLQDNLFISTHASLFEHVDKLFDGNESDQIRAHELLEQNSSDLMGHVDFVWRLCKSTFLLSKSYGHLDKDNQRHLIYEALKLATLALELDDSSSNAHKWYAITLGSTNDFESVNAKIENGHKFKVHIEKAITLNPCDPSIHYLLGRWCFAIYMMSWIERKIAATLFSSPPQATIDESLNHFLKANELNSEKWKENLLFIAKCYIEKRDIPEAVRWLKEAKNVPSVTNDDTENHSEILTYLEKYAGVI